MEETIPGVNEEIQRPTRTRNAPKKLIDYEYTLPPSNLATARKLSPSFNVQVMSNEFEYPPEYLCSLNAVLQIQERTTYNEAAKHLGWIEAMKKEIEALESNNTWKVTNLPHVKHAINSKWVYKTKMRPDGSIARLKARLVARGDK